METGSSEGLDKETKFSKKLLHTDSLVTHPSDDYLSPCPSSYTKEIK